MSGRHGRIPRAERRGVGRRFVGAFLVGGISVLAIAPAATRAATVRLRSEATLRGIWNVVEYQAAPGELNDVMLSAETRSGASITIRDAGALVVPGELCESLDVHTARCGPVVPLPTASPFPYVRLELGDMNDALRSAADVGGGSNNGIGVIANGGAGDDVLDARNSFQALLDGGGGTDRLRGTDYYDLLTDGDRDDVSGDGSPGPDVLDGGPAMDLVSYRQRTAPVSVDLADRLPDGEIGEGDTLRGVEAIWGGSGDDQLGGDDRSNALDGGGGHDSLTGRGGADQFGFNGPFVDVGPYRLPLPAPTSGDSVTCGRGTDIIWGRRATDFVEQACEVISVRRRLPFKRPNQSRSDTTYLPAYPTQNRAGLSYWVTCSREEDWDDLDWAQLRCSGTVQLRESSGRRRLLAGGKLPRGRGQLTAQLRLTTLGRRLATQRIGVRATLRIQGRRLPSAAWTIRLKLRSTAN